MYNRTQFVLRFLISVVLLFFFVAFYFPFTLPNFYTSYIMHTYIFIVFILPFT